MKFIAAVIILTITYFVQKMLFSKYWNRGLETDVYFNRDFVECGENAELVEIVTNRKALPLPVFHLKFSVDKSLKFLDNEFGHFRDSELSFRLLEQLCIFIKAAKFKNHSSGARPCRTQRTL